MRIAVVVLAMALVAVAPEGVAQAAPTRPPAADLPAGRPQPPADWQPDAALRARLRTAEPAVAAWLADLAVRNPHRERMTLWQFSEDERGIARLRKEDPARVASYQERGRLEREVAMLIDAARQVHGEARDVALAKLEARLQEMLAAREKVRDEQVDALRRRVADLERARGVPEPR